MNKMLQLIYKYRVSYKYMYETVLQAKSVHHIHLVIYIYLVIRHK